MEKALERVFPWSVLSGDLLTELEHQMMEKGLLIVHTGPGKGKTTAALGMAMRAAGHGLRVCFIQFVKGPGQYGEREAMGRFDDLIDLHVMGKGFIRTAKDPEPHIQAARRGWDMAREAITSGRYAMVVLDEFTYPLKYEMVDLCACMAVLASRPPQVHVVITGRDASPALIAAADLVTEMQAVKHPFSRGVPAQKGVEF